MRILFVLFFTCIGWVFADIDVVIPCIEKDKRTLDLCIEGIRKNGKDIRRIIVVSNKRLTEKAEWFDERKYPFSKEDVASCVYGTNDSTLPRVGWLFQQLLKLYAPLAIPGISDKVLLLDADTIFLRPVTFVEDDGVANYNVGSEFFPEYFTHMKKLLPDLYKVFPGYSGICHHMLIQGHVIEALFREVEELHSQPFWKVCLEKVDSKTCMMSEYEIYFNYVFSRKLPANLRFLKWVNTSLLRRIGKFERRKVHYVSIHAWMEELL